MNDMRIKTDEEIAEILKKNDDALALLIDRYEKKLDRYIRRTSSFAEEERRDLLQDIFLSVYENIHSFDSSMKFSSWIYRIAHNKTISRWRKQKKRNLDISMEEYSLPMAEIIGKESEFIEKMEREENHRLVYYLLSRISPRYRDILILFFIEGKSYEEISDILMIPVATVGTHIRRAKKEMKGELERLRTQQVL